MNTIFPALVTLPTGEVLDTAFVADDTTGVTVWVWDRRMRRAVIAAEGPGPLGRDGIEYGFADTDGRLVKFVDTEGCGCGHPMKHFRPPRQR